LGTATVSTIGADGAAGGRGLAFDSSTGHLHLRRDRSLVELTVAGEVVAFALFFTNFSTFLAQPGLYLEDLYVRPAHRGAGVGKALLRHLGRLSMDRGCGRFEWSVLDWNADAIEFYQKLGATVMPDWRICRMTGDALSRFAGGDAASS